MNYKVGIFVVVIFFTVLFGSDRVSFAVDLDKESARISLELAKAKVDLDEKKTRYLEKKREFENPNIFSKYVGEPIAHGLEKDMNRRKKAYEEAQAKYQQLCALQKKLESWKYGKLRESLIENLLNLIMEDNKSKSFSSGTVALNEENSW